MINNSRFEDNLDDIEMWNNIAKSKFSNFFYIWSTTFSNNIVLSQYTKFALGN